MASNASPSGVCASCQCSTISLKIIFSNLDCIRHLSLWPGSFALLGFWDTETTCLFLPANEIRIKFTCSPSGQYQWVLSRLIFWIKGVFIAGRMRCLPAIKGAHIYRGRRDRWWHWWLWRFRAISVIIVISCLCYDFHSVEDYKEIGRQIQIVQAGGNDRRPPSKSVGQSRLAGIVVERDKVRLRWCDCGDWWHAQHLVVWSLRGIEYIRRVVSSRAGLIR